MQKNNTSNTVKLVYNVHHRDPPKKWPLLTDGRCSGVIYIREIQKVPENSGRYRQVVTRHYSEEVVNLGSLYFFFVLMNVLQLGHRYE